MSINSGSSDIAMQYARGFYPEGGPEPSLKPYLSATAIAGAELEHPDQDPSEFVWQGTEEGEDKK